MSRTGARLRVALGLILQPVIAGAFAYVTSPLFLLDGRGHTSGGGYPADVNDAALSLAAGAVLAVGAITVVIVTPLVVWRFCS